MFWEKFYALCEQAGTKPLCVVKELSIAAGSITKWKNGSIPNGDNLAKIAGFFNVSVDYLLDDDRISDMADTKSIVKQLYKDNDIPIKEIEDRLGVDYATFKAWIDGRGDYFNDKLYLIADLFGVSVDYLLGRADIADTDTELDEYLEELRTRPEMKMLFSLTKNATKEDVEKAVKIIETMLGK